MNPVWFLPEGFRLQCFWNLIALRLSQYIYISSVEEAIKRHPKCFKNLNFEILNVPRSPNFC